MSINYLWETISFVYLRLNNCYTNLNLCNLYYFSGFLKKNEANLKKEFAKKRPDLIDHIIWNSHTKPPSQNGITGIIHY